MLGNRDSYEGGKSLSIGGVRGGAVGCISSTVGTGLICVVPGIFEFESLQQRLQCLNSQRKTTNTMNMVKTPATAATMTLVANPVGLTPADTTKSINDPDINICIH